MLTNLHSLAVLPSHDRHGVGIEVIALLLDQHQQITLNAVLRELLQQHGQQQSQGKASGYEHSHYMHGIQQQGDGMRGQSKARKAEGTTAAVQETAETRKAYQEAQ